MEKRKPVDKIGNRFHGSSCSLRYNGTLCTCGLEERLEAEKIEKERLKAKKGEANQGEPLRELVRMARIIARAYLYEVGMDGAPQPEEQADDIVDMAFKVLEGSWITRTYTSTSVQKEKK